MNPLTLIFVVALLVAIWWLVRKRRDSVADDAKTEVKRPVANTQFHAVSIKYPTNVCEAAKQMSGRRFLATAAPKLPLADCNVLDCSCRFTHHKDRRAGRDRRSPFRQSRTGTDDAEQRDDSGGRREED